MVTLPVMVSCDLCSTPFQADSMLNLLKANHYKLLCTHAELCGQQKPNNEFESYITKTSDKHV
jgi:hypothetical protein